MQIIIIILRNTRSLIIMNLTTSVSYIQTMTSPGAYTESLMPGAILRGGVAGRGGSEREKIYFYRVGEGLPLSPLN